MKLRNIILPFLLILAVVMAPQPSLAKYASIVVNETTGKVLYSRNADKKLFPASLTKVMTLYILFEELEEGRITMDTRMKVSKVAAGRSPSKLGLKAGSTIKVKDAMLALITKSANDVATVIAEHLGGTERKFAKRMTRKARALGMTRTNFRNASGLPHSKQHSTARDMARLAIAIRKDFPQYFPYFKTQTYTWKGKRFKNHNTLLRTFKGTDGIKTGYTRASGFNLIATTERNSTRLVGVVFGGRTGSSRDKHMKYLLAKQFDSLPRFTKPVVRQARAPVRQQLPVPPQKPRVVALAAVNDPPPNPSPPLRRPSSDLPELIDPALPETTSAPSSWGIQIGSFSKRHRAHIAARNARKLADQIIPLQPARLSEVQYGEVTFWQVQFTGVDEDNARAACILLHRSGMACIVVPSSLA